MAKNSKWKIIFKDDFEMNLFYCHGLQIMLFLWVKIIKLLLSELCEIHLE